MHKLRFTTVAKLVIILLILLLIPLSAFNLPKSQMVLEGFDPKLVDIDTPSGVTLNSSMLVFVAETNEADPSVTTVTSPASFTINVEATVIKQAGEVHPLHISIWDKTAATNDAFSIYFHSPSNKIVYQVINSTNQLDIEVGEYTQNCPYDIQISFSANSCLDFSIANSTWSPEPVTLNPANATILKRPMVSLRFFAQQYAQGGESVAVLQKYQVEFPSQDYFVFFTNLLGANLNFAYVILFAAIVILWRNDFSEAFNRTTSFSRRIGNKIRHGSKEAKLMAILFFSSALLQVCISFLGSQPYDSFAQKTWAYINTKYGLKYLYTLSDIAPSGRSVGTFSIINLGYPYPPLLGYVYLLMGRIYAVVSPTFDLNAPLFGLLIKTPWILATSALGLLIYYFTRKTYSAKVAFVLASLYLFNPCVIFESTIWSQSDAILASFLISSVLALRSNSSRSVWFFLGLSLLTKQTAVVPAVFISFFALRKFGVRKVIRSLAFPFVCVFLFVNPYLMLGYSPSFIFNVSVGQNVLNMVSTPQRVAEWQIAASAGAHNIWPILTRLLADQSGWSRFAYPYQSSALMSSLASFGTCIVLICFALIIVQSLISEKPKNTKESPTFYMLFLVVLSLYMFFTRMQTRYLYLTIPFLILSFAWIRNRRVFALLFGTLTTTFFLSDYSYFTLTSVWQPAYLPNFSPNVNPLNSTMFQFINDDTFITALCSAILALFVLSMLFSNYRTFGSKIHIKKEKMQAETFLSETYKPQWFPAKFWHVAVFFYGTVFTDYIQLILKRGLKQGSSVLELGCGKGSSVTSLVNNLKLSVGVDLHKPSLLNNKKHKYFENYLLADIRTLPFKSNSFDCVVALDVIEHLSKPDGYRLMKQMENISRKKVVILTPNGFSPKQHLEDSNVLQHHRCAWVSSEFLSLGYTVSGINGYRAFRGEQAHAAIKPRPIGHLVSKLTDRFVYDHPSNAFQLLCVKSKLRLDEQNIPPANSSNTIAGADFF